MPTIPLPDTENRLTWNWVHALREVPGLGQRLVDFIAERCELTPATFVEAAYQPRLGSPKTPDCMLVTDDWSILFEHKLDAPLGPRQLQDYLAIASARPRTYVALVAPEPYDIPHEVCVHSLFRPKAATQFFWQDFHPLVASCEGTRAADYRQFFEGAGLRYAQLPNIGDPFVDSEARARYCRINKFVSERVRGGFPKARPHTKAKMALQIQQPMGNVHLAYVVPKPSSGLVGYRIRGPILIMLCQVAYTSDERVLPPADEKIEGAGLPILVSTEFREPRRMDASKYRVERSYATELEPLFAPGTNPVERISSFVLTSLAHLRESARTGQRRISETSVADL